MGNSFWTDYTVEPKRAYRWILQMNGIPQWIVKSVKKPSFEITESEHQYINHTFYYPGRVKWSEITVTLVDPIAPDASKTIQDIINASGYHFPLDPNDTTTISKANAVSSLGRVLISQLGANEGETVEEWLLINAWIKNVEMGDLSYDSDELTNITLTLRYDYAQLIKSGPGVPI